jgi:pimeloyl-ACP methyl ester carboxylesterase
VSDTDDGPSQQAVSPLHLRRGPRGGTEPLLLLIHGLGATGEVWRPLQEALRRRGRTSTPWVAVDLPGHGRSPTRTRYSFGGLAGDVADSLAADGVSARREVVIVGHSLGAAVGLTLATGWFGLRVGTCVSLGLKTVFTTQETERAHEVAGRPAKVFPSREAAAQFWLKLGGLSGVVSPHDEMLTDALIETPTGWRVTFDNAVTGLAGADVPGLLSANRARTLLVRGEHDAMVSADDIHDLGMEPVIITDAGHNVHVERPDAVADLLLELETSPPG